MDSEEDDFGDLYADLDDQVNAGITAVGESHSAKEFDSTSEECCADERAGEAGETQMGCYAGRDLDLEADGTESEDELHIVLNEEDGSNLPTSERCSGGWYEEEEDEDEDLVIVTGSEHHQNNSRKHGERLSNVDELKQRSAKRVGVPKVVCNGWVFNDASDSVQFVNGERVPYAMDNLDKGLTRLEMVTVEEPIEDGLAEESRNSEKQDRVYLEPIYDNGHANGFAISICTTRYGRYTPVHQVTGTRIVCYPAVPPKIDHRQSISAVGGRLREKSTVGGRLREKSTIGDRLREKKGRRRRGGEERSTSFPHVVLARTPSLPAGAFSPAQGDGTSPRFTYLSVPVYRAFCRYPYDPVLGGMHSAYHPI
ncbi:hypothetical protein GW17_00002681 [Ensete ventricosum]|nr:hypothetical protein GW17_00002681 [Ensete ventricosum]